MPEQRTIVIDPGHGGKDPGAIYGGLKEKQIVLFICLDIAFRLKEINEKYNVHLTRPTDLYISPLQRAEFANRVCSNLFVSVHCNADADFDMAWDSEAKGEEIWISLINPESMVAAKAMKTWVDLIFPGEPFRGIKASTCLTVLNVTKSAAILIEVGFIDKSSSLETFSSMKTLQKISGLLTAGIDQYFVNTKGGD
jgi:N-acetylmuramoyl-L-alanine amidase